MRTADVFYKDEKAGTLIQQNDGTFLFRYTDEWMNNEQKPAISPTLSKHKQEYSSTHLFPFFFNMLPEGVNKQLISRELGIDEDDFFGLLTAAAKYDTVGAVRVVQLK